MTKYIPTLNPNSSSLYFINFKVHDCAEGELFKDNQCTPCPRDTFLNEKVVGTLTKCNSCTDFDYFYCYGGSMRSPKLDFWRFSNNSTQFLKCLSTACLGDIYFFKNFTEIDCLNCFLPASNKELLFYSFDPNLNAIGFCKYGYTGNMCSECIKGFGSSGYYKCTDCSSYKPYIMQSLVAVANLILFYYTCWISIINNTSSSNIDKNSPQFIENINSSYLLNILFAYLNIIAVLKLIPFEFGDLAEELFKYSSELSPTEKVEIFSFGCLLKRVGIKLPSVYFEIIINLLFFLLSSVILSMFFYIQTKKIPNRKNFSIKASLKGVFLIYLMNNLIRILGPSFRVLLCVNLGDEKDPRSFLLSDMSLECNSLQHNIFRYLISIPLIIILAVIIPIIVMFQLFRERNSKKDKKFLLTYGYFIYPLRKQAYYFQIFSIINKLIIINFREIFMNLIITNNQPMAPALLIFYLLIIYFFQKFASPYDKRKYMLIQKMSMLSYRTNISNSLCALIWTLIE
ncbi:MAG: hypothetical protein HQK87_11675, partial [Nitrospinae bacterium]|nr:hypothetical protein [Nitrospinota bacterium]